MSQSIQEGLVHIMVPTVNWSLQTSVFLLNDMIAWYYIYDGASSFLPLLVKMRILKYIRNLISSQCKALTTGMICAHLFILAQGVLLGSVVCGAFEQNHLDFWLEYNCNSQVEHLQIHALAGNMKLDQCLIWPSIVRCSSKLHDKICKLVSRL